VATAAGRRRSEQEISVNLSEVAMAAAITVSVAGVSYATFNVDAVTGSAREVADRATCRAVYQAIVGYVAQNGTAPKTIEQVEPWVRGDITAYRIVGGDPTGPGC
jgi:hypothetical protein